MRTKTAIFIVFSLVAPAANAQTAGMQSFQGRLKQNGSPINGNVTLEFRVFDAATNGNQVDATGDGQVTAADTFTQSNVAASNGLISTKFGPVHPSAFNGSPRWLEVTITDPLPVTTLPRLEMATAVATAERLNVPGTGSASVTVKPSGDVNVGRVGAAGFMSLMSSSGVETIKLRSDSSFNGPGLQMARSDGSPMAEIGNQSTLGGFLLLSAGDGDGNVYASGDQGDGGGELRIANGQSPNQETFRVSGNDAGSAGARLSLFNGTTGNNQETITLDGNNGGAQTGGALITLANGQSPNHATIALDANGSPGGRVSVYNGQGSNQQTITLDGNDGSGAGRVSMRNATGIAVTTLRTHPNGSGVLDLLREDGAAGITLEGNGSCCAGGGFIHIRSATAGTNTISLAGNGGVGGGLISISNGLSLNHETIRFDGNDGAGNGQISVKSDTTSASVIISSAYTGGGAEVFVRDSSGSNTIRLTGQGGTVTACTLNPTGGCDVAESFDLTNRERIQPGMVLVLDDQRPGHLTLSTHAYDKKVAGIVSGAGGLKPGVVLGGSGSDEPNPPLAHARGSDSDLPIALSGRVYCYVDATRHAVEIGDLLTTSDTPGYAMKVTDFPHSQGAVLGKAMAPLAKGKKGLVLVLVGLQ